MLKTQSHFSERSVLTQLLAIIFYNGTNMKTVLMFLKHVSTSVVWETLT